MSSLGYVSFIELIYKNFYIPPQKFQKNIYLKKSPGSRQLKKKKNRNM